MDRNVAVETGIISRCELAFGPNSEGACFWCGLPAPDATRWCSPACEDAWADAHVWPRARNAALRRVARRCQECRRTSRDGVRIEVHHETPVPADGGYEPGCQHHADGLVVLCAEHHQRRHRWLRARPGEQLALFRAA